VRIFGAVPNMTLDPWHQVPVTLGSGGLARETRRHNQIDDGQVDCPWHPGPVVHALGPDRGRPNRATDLRRREPASRWRQ
jgi:hypothetical protein